MDSKILFVDSDGIIYSSISRKVCYDGDGSLLGKRKLRDAFGDEIYNDNDRYGQDITPDFFETNVGHGVK